MLHVNNLLLCKGDRSRGKRCYVLFAWVARKVYKFLGFVGRACTGRQAQKVGNDAFDQWE